MYRTFTDREIQVNDDFDLEDYKHLIKVLRFSIGDKIEVAGKNGTFLCEIIGADSKVEVRALEKIKSSHESPVEITLYQALAKGQKLEEVIQSSVELGVSKIVPFTSKRCVVRLNEKKKRSKIKRYRAIAEASAQQSKRDYIPEVGDFLDFSDLPAEGAILAYEEEGSSLKDTLRTFTGENVSFIVGPEGGFDKEEVETLKKKGCKVVNFGPRILRTEHAGAFLISACQYELGDMG